MRHIVLDFNLKEILIYGANNIKIDKNTYLSVPEGFKAIVTLGGHRIGREIGPCNYVSLMEKMEFNKKDLNASENYSVYFVADRYKLLTFLWGTSAQEYDKEYEVDYKWGANGTYTVSIDDPIVLLKSIEGRPNPILKKHIDSFETDMLFSHVRMQVTNSISKFIKNENISVFSLNSKLNDVSGEIKKAFLDYDAITNKMGLKFIDIAVKEIGINEDEMERVRKAIEGKKKERLEKLKIESGVKED